ncbi:RNA polymerase sigma factor [Haliangium ochraceum]|uniref:RNA polymerase, sigma-24 subunit, ECF subfamily n=1 Tax=Haliangium ochraceum (strain DSM 14365 / JCM 11303 / SMP-2) TaxID=502025 RepID=D0LU63_HALO1|nr:RNA polymerase sigma factor [Haliangium ochraceum]ACY17427.1 RNA polymerase, sigma-24 subunit, ECF subfamily [Haliangium ochraceum DSM 14365]
MEEERELMGRYCDGDAAAFRALYQLVAPRILSYLLRMARERALAEDLLQLTFLKVHRARGSYVRDANPMPWFYSIAHRTFLDEARKRQRAKVQLSSSGHDVPEQAAHITGRAADQVEEPGADAEMAKAALAALDNLPEKQREAVVLTKLSGKSIAEAAAITGTTPGAMKVRAHRGYVALRKALGSGGGASS